MNATPPPDSNVGSGIRPDVPRSASTNSRTAFRKIVTSGRLSVIVGIVALGLLGLRVAAAQRNLAWRKEVRMENILLGNPASAVNGVIEWGSYAVHTRRGAASFEVDLEEPSNIGIVRIYGRGDGFHMDSRMPIVVMHSVDGQMYSIAGSCGLVLTQVAPCEVDLGGAFSRYVRLSHPTHLVLSEVEVFPAQ